MTFLRKSCAFLLWLLLTSAAYAAGPPVNPPPPSVPAPTQPQEAPSLSVPAPVFDFGEIVEGEVVVHDFSIRNSGTEALRIDQVRPG